MSSLSEATTDAVDAPEEVVDGGFRVAVGEFEGPFDLLLNLISKHELDITEISLTNVSFAYDEAHPILQDVSISIRKGDVIALTGPTGIGKSTLIGLLLRLIDPVSGNVSINGIPATQLDPEGLRNIYATVLQETVLFQGTIRENLLLARPGATADEIEHAVDAAALTDRLLRSVWVQSSSTSPAQDTSS